MFYVGAEAVQLIDASRKKYDAGLRRTLGVRYVTSDPIGLRGGLNSYNYVFSNPLYYYDANGAIAVPLITGAIGAVIGGATGAYSGGFRGLIYGAAGGFIGGALGGVGTGAIAGGALGSVLSAPVRGGLGRSVTAGVGSISGTLASTLGSVGESLGGKLPDQVEPESRGPLPDDPDASCEADGCCWVVKTSFWSGNRIEKVCPHDDCE